MTEQARWKPMPSRPRRLKPATINEVLNVLGYSTRNQKAAADRGNEAITILLRHEEAARSEMEPSPGRMAWRNSPFDSINEAREFLDHLEGLIP